ncbi:hypothetical protein IFVP182_C290333 [Vibrio parahaemolyticus]
MMIQKVSAQLSAGIQHLKGLKNEKQTSVSVYDFVGQYAGSWCRASSKRQ